MEEAYAGYLGEDEDGTCVYLTDTVKVTQADVRKLQLAKASIAAGIRILLSERNISVTDVEQVILAGGFGSFLNKKSAAAIGLIPEELEPVTISVGNAAGEGAVSAGSVRGSQTGTGPSAAGDALCGTVYTQKVQRCLYGRNVFRIKN